MRRTFSLTCILLACGVLPRANGQTVPSPLFMVESWKAWTGEFAHKVHSYRLQGRGTISKSGIRVAGRSTVGQTWTWQTIRQSTQYRYEDVQPEEYKAVSYDGVKWYYVVHTGGQSPQQSVMTRGPYIGGSVLVPFQQEETHPQTIEAYTNSPGMYPSDIPLPDQFLAQRQKLHLMGTDVIAGKRCYHLHFGANLNPHLPADVWLTQIGHYFVPWQTQTSPGDGSVRGTVIVQAGTDFDGVWYPTACSCRVDQGDAAHGYTTIQETAKTFPISEINRVFPVTDFQLQPLKNSDRFVDDKVVQPPAPKRLPPARVAQNAKNMLRRGLLLLFAVCSILLLLTFLKRRPLGK